MKEENSNRCPASPETLGRYCQPNRADSCRLMVKVQENCVWLTEKYRIFILLFFLTFGSEEHKTKQKCWGKGGGEREREKMERIERWTET